ncbi:3-phosphoshikimate 1-carboxyvinyltransferase [Ornithinimicrobium humiphilum]|uniref:3-phosphoshikimate 1-carboxyvinyltransferase n=1 Tax=Ornithinimicrobium humiphilum TaxID=125288 RepID=A0A543KQY2_9MICO|nr:3-phosphoshikimate 1-carboxyvinyltransferase [Ornithinimicrobium humiphilum]TQM97481.1 3-phosphoshikimate 1-carboxyvinyltransferase [Ornithinimicrobium humiphilum]
MTDPLPWPAPSASGPVDAVVTVPGSKSLTNRWLVLAALAEGTSTLRRPLRSRDSERMVDALRALGVEVDDRDDQAWFVTPPVALHGDVDVDCGQAGTVMRFVPPVAALAAGPVRFDGHPTARLRPVGPVLEALRGLGADVEDGGRGTLPYTVDGRGGLRGGTVEIDASASSQFVSALLLAGARFEQGLLLRHTGASLPSLPHVEMTLQVLEQVGVRVHRPDQHSWRVEPGPVAAFDVVVEPDLSSAAPFLALAAVTGGTVTVRDWPTTTTQPGDGLRRILQGMGATTSLSPEGLLVQGAGDGRLTGVDLDLSAVGELTPVVAALATLADGPSRLRGIAHLRGHETDRLAALVTEIGRLGGRARETDDGLVVEPTGLSGALLRTYHDHRMAMFAAVVGAVVPGVEIEDVTTADKTFPDFHLAWAGAVATGRDAGDDRP